MSTLYLIASEEQEQTGESVVLLKAAAKERSIPVAIIHPETFDYTNIPKLSNGDMLYRVRVGEEAALIERLLLHNGVATFYHDVVDATRPYVDRPLVLERAGVSIVPTIFGLSNERDVLDRSVEKLGGFPVVVKEVGGSHGVGVMKLDSTQSLYSVADVMLSKGGKYLMRAYIDYEQHLRLVVVDDRVVGTVEYPRIKNDFRSNVGEDIDVVAVEVSTAIQDMAVQAVHAYDLEFGGVDILTDKDGSAYVAEANFPCFFPRVQLAQGGDVAGAMLDHLVKKSKQVTHS